MNRFLLILFLFFLGCFGETDPCSVMCDNCMGTEHCQECYDSCYDSLSNE